MDLSINEFIVFSACIALISFAVGIEFGIDMGVGRVKKLLEICEKKEVVKQFMEKA